MRTYIACSQSIRLLRLSLNQSEHFTSSRSPSLHHPAFCAAKRCLSRSGPGEINDESVTKASWEKLQQSKNKAVTETNRLRTKGREYFDEGVQDGKNALREASESTQNKVQDMKGSVRGVMQGTRQSLRRPSKSNSAHESLGTNLERTGNKMEQGASDASEKTSAKLQDVKDRVGTVKDEVSNKAVAYKDLGKFYVAEAKDEAQAAAKDMKLAKDESTSQLKSALGKVSSIADEGGNTATKYYHKTSKVVGNAIDKAGKAAEYIKDAAQSTTGEIRSQVENVVGNKADASRIDRNVAEAASKQLRDNLDSAKETVTIAARDTNETAEDMREKAVNSAEQATDKVKSKVGTAADSVDKKVDEVSAGKK